jgi:hypothetical protein
LGERVCIEPINGDFCIVLIQNSERHEMDRRQTLADAQDYALYLANSMKLDVYYDDNRLTFKK